MIFAGVGNRPVLVILLDRQRLLNELNIVCMRKFLLHSFVCLYSFFTLLCLFEACWPAVVD